TSARRDAGLAAVEEARAPPGLGRELAAGGLIAERDSVDLLAIGQQRTVAGLDEERQAQLAPPVLPFGDDIAVADLLEHPVVEVGIAVHELNGARKHAFLADRGGDGDADILVHWDLDLDRDAALFERLAQRDGLDRLLGAVVVGRTELGDGEGSRGGLGAPARTELDNDGRSIDPDATNHFL